jgi:hypothetical protein
LEETTEHHVKDLLSYINQNMQNLCRELTETMEKTQMELRTVDVSLDKPCLVTVDTKVYITVARPDIADGWPERQPYQRFTLQTVSEETLPILKEVFLTLNLEVAPIENLGFHH